MNSPSTSSFYSDPHIQFLSQILQDIRRGELLVPRFQRPFVWLQSQQLELLRSIRQGIPIGAIMVWRTASAQIACYDALGPFSLQPGRSAGTRDYLLDGVQRLSTLYGALNSPSMSAAVSSDGEDDEDEYESSQIYDRAFFDLKQLDFLFIKPEDQPTPHQLPLNILLDSVVLLRYQRSLSAYKEAESMVEECDRLAGAFRQYKIPIIPIATDDLALATLTFQRINSQGQKMSDYHMLHALTWSSSFDLMRQLNDLRSEYLSPVGWDTIDEDPVLKVLKLILGLDVYKADIEELSKRVTNHPTCLESAVASIAKTATFLKDELGIPSHEFVPYSLQIVLLADTLRNFPSLDFEQKILLRNWFWFITYSEAFSGISDDKVRTALEDMRAMLLRKYPVWNNKAIFQGLNPLLRYDFRAVRTKSFILNMARTQPEDEEFSTTEFLAEYGRRGIQQIFPPAIFPPSDRKLALSLGNRVICSPVLLSKLRKETFPVMTPWAKSKLLGNSIQFPTAAESQDNNLHRWAAEFMRIRETNLFTTEEQFAKETAGEFWSQVL